MPVRPGSGLRGRRKPISGLDGDERALLGAALRALRRERGAAWMAACDRAVAVHARTWFRIRPNQVTRGARKRRPVRAGFQGNGVL